LIQCVNLRYAGAEAAPKAGLYCNKIVHRVEEWEGKQADDKVKNRNSATVTA